MKVELTEEEARVLYTAMYNSWLPVVGSKIMSAAIQKLGVIGGGFCCRDCTKLAHHSHHLGGLVCDDHRPVRKLEV